VLAEKVSSLFFVIRGQPGSAKRKCDGIGFRRLYLRAAWSAWMDFRATR